MLKKYAERNIVTVKCEKRSVARCSSCAENEACVEFKQGIQKHYHCAQIGCGLNDSSTCDSPSSTCIQAPNNTSVCVPNAGSLVEGTNCSARNCMAHRGSLTSCQELSINSSPIATSCVTVRASCEDLRCRKKKECVEKIRDGQVLSARCEKTTKVQKALTIT